MESEGAHYTAQTRLEAAKAGEGRDVNNGVVFLSAKILCQQTGVSCRGQSKFINGRKTDPLVSILMARPPQAKREREEHPRAAV